MKYCSVKNTEKSNNYRYYKDHSHLIGFLPRELNNIVPK